MRDASQAATGRRSGRVRRRRLFNLAAAVSLVLCVATVVLWVRSHWYLDDIHLFPDPQSHYFLRSADGRLHAQQTRASAPTWQADRNWHSSTPLAHPYVSGANGLRLAG